MFYNCKILSKSWPGHMSKSTRLVLLHWSVTTFHFHLTVSSKCMKLLYGGGHMVLLVFYWHDDCLYFFTFTYITLILTNRMQLPAMIEHSRYHEMVVTFSIIFLLMRFFNLLSTLPKSFNISKVPFYVVVYYMLTCNDLVDHQFFIG